MIKDGMGDIYITTDKNIAINWSAVNPNNHVLLLQDEMDVDKQFMQIVRGLLCSALLPDIKSFRAQMEEGDEAFERLYFQYLASSEAPASIAISILSGLCRGNNFILFAEAEHAATFVNKLVKYFANSYGLTIGFLDPIPNRNRECTFNIEYTIPVVCQLYLFDLYDVNELLLDYPQGAPLDQRIIGKLVHDVNPYIGIPNPTFQDYYNYFYNLKERTKVKGKVNRVFMHREV